jgi:hypothetical protein
VREVWRVLAWAHQEGTQLRMPKRVEAARVGAQQLASPEYREELVGTAGSTPL